MTMHRTTLITEKLFNNTCKIIKISELEIKNYMALTTSWVGQPNCFSILVNVLTISLSTVRALPSVDTS